jgi:hypothetical protein
VNISSNTGPSATVANVRIDTVIIDQTQITKSKFRIPDFQTKDIPTDSKIFSVRNYVDNNLNMFVGLSHFYLAEKTHYKYEIIQNPTNVTINIDSLYNFARIVFRNLHFIKL